MVHFTTGLLAGGENVPHKAIKKAFYGKVSHNMLGATHKVSQDY